MTNYKFEKAARQRKIIAFSLAIFIQLALLSLIFFSENAQLLEKVKDWTSKQQTESAEQDIP